MELIINEYVCFTWIKRYVGLLLPCLFHMRYNWIESTIFQFNPYVKLKHNNHILMFQMARLVQNEDIHFNLFGFFFLKTQTKMPYFVRYWWNEIPANKQVGEVNHLAHDQFTNAEVKNKNILADFSRNHP